MSIHIAAKKTEVAQTVLLPGDPLRAEWIAKNFLKEVKRYNTIRNMFGFTGVTNSGKRISVQGSGMGQPSLAIYVEELIDYYGVKKIIRVGSCGALQPNINIRDVILVQGSCTDSAMNKRIFDNMTYAPIADFKLLHKAFQTAKKLKIPVKVGNNFATDTFYDWHKNPAWKIFAAYNVLSIEMESAMLYTIAARKKIQALSILTVSDNLVNKKFLSSAEREKTFSQMIEIALRI